MPKVLGSGSYATVLRVSKSKVIKVFESKAERLNEWKVQQIVKELDPARRFTVECYGQGLLNPRHYPVLMEDLYLDMQQDSLGYIEYEYGGKALEDMSIFHHESVPCVLQAFLPLFEGLVAMNMVPMMHFDIKGPNIVYRLQEREEDDAGTIMSTGNEDGDEGGDHDHDSDDDQPRIHLRFVDFGFYDQYKEVCSDSCYRYEYHPVECTMMSLLFGRHGRARSASEYHTRLREAVASGRLQFGPATPEPTPDGSPPTDEWLLQVIGLLGFKQSAGAVDRLRANFRKSIDSLLRIEKIHISDATDDDLARLFRARVAQFTAFESFDEAWRDMVLENHVYHSKADVFALGIQLTAALASKQRHHIDEIGDFDTSVFAVYADVLQLCQAMTSVNVDTRITAVTALQRFRDLLAMHTGGASDSVASKAPQKRTRSGLRTPSRASRRSLTRSRTQKLKRTQSPSDAFGDVFGDEGGLFTFSDSVDDVFRLTDRVGSVSRTSAPQRERVLQVRVPLEPEEDGEDEKAAPACKFSVHVHRHRDA
jgi:serine/threonine protein kinase